MMSVRGIPGMDVLGRQEQQSKHTDCGENGDDSPAGAAWQHHRHYVCGLTGRQTTRWKADHCCWLLTEHQTL
jgi:hypothetical protein